MSLRIQVLRHAASQTLSHIANLPKRPKKRSLSDFLEEKYRGGDKMPTVGAFEGERTKDEAAKDFETMTSLATAHEMARRELADYQGSDSSSSESDEKDVTPPSAQNVLLVSAENFSLVSILKEGLDAGPGSKVEEYEGEETEEPFDRIVFERESTKMIVFTMPDGTVHLVLSGKNLNHETSKEHTMLQDTAHSVSPQAADKCLSLTPQRKRKRAVNNANEGRPGKRLKINAPKKTNATGNDSTSDYLYSRKYAKTFLPDASDPNFPTEARCMISLLNKRLQEYLRMQGT